VCVPLTIVNFALGHADKLTAPGGSDNLVGGFALAMGGFH
jgi:hypothetical protein